VDVLEVSCYSSCVCIRTTEYVRLFHEITHGSPVFSMTTLSDQSELNATIVMSSCNEVRLCVVE